MTRILTDTDADVTPLSEDQIKVVNFRFEWLHSAGWSRSNANRIAEDLSVDWHFAHDLIKQCPDEKLALQIIYGRESRTRGKVTHE